ncbi:MAG: magnesium transporter CorA family protein [Saprospiraceae bacterium]|nr:magnesium transporter CorA family protein [Saprospiraceae bacterium]
MINFYTTTNNKLEQLESLQTFCWINVTPPISPDEIEYLSDTLQIPHDFFTDPLDIDERARYEKEDDIKLIVINTPVLNDGYRNDEAIFITIPIGLILVNDHVITITNSDNTIIELFIDNKVKNVNVTDVSLFILQIFEQNVFRFLSCLKKLNLKRNLLEKELYDSSRNQDLQQLLSIQKSLIYFVNSLSANELLKMKIKRTDLLSLKDNEFKYDLFEDLIIDNSQALEMSKIYSNILSSTMETHSSIISNNLGMIMQRLTLITIILMVPTVIASFFGMNVPVPMSENNYSFLYIFLGSILMSVALAFFFRRKRLL